MVVHYFNRPAVTANRLFHDKESHAGVSGFPIKYVLFKHALLTFVRDADAIIGNLLFALHQFLLPFFSFGWQRQPILYMSK